MMCQGFLRSCESSRLFSLSGDLCPAVQMTGGRPIMQPTSPAAPLCDAFRLGCQARTPLAAKCNVDTCPHRIRQKPPNPFQQATKELSDGNILWRWFWAGCKPMTSRGERVPSFSLHLSCMLYFVLPSAICATSSSFLYLGKNR